ncbi:nitroreductase family deazaflavin-dependent oxidoreductase [Streptomyces sp. NPDC002896]|uniref:nitroreductase family deazaflavin-dependent oxidoreductase n=1 Tax=Streptomyces sp. NPDC002896 TaxID=3154438 RepID=UPI003323D19D
MSHSYTPPDISLVGAEHVRRYLETDGAVGHTWNGVHCLVLTTTGRTSGLQRSSALIYGTDADRYIVVASNGGSAGHPSWYLNVLAGPEVVLQVAADRFPAVAHTAEGPERERLWQVMTKVWPNYDVYQERTERLIPVVVLERKDSPS